MMKLDTNNKENWLLRRCAAATCARAVPEFMVPGNQDMAVIELSKIGDTKAPNKFPEILQFSKFRKKERRRQTLARSMQIPGRVHSPNTHTSYFIPVTSLISRKGQHTAGGRRKSHSQYSTIVLINKIYLHTHTHQAFFSPNGLPCV